MNKSLAQRPKEQISLLLAIKLILLYCTVTEYCFFTMKTYYRRKNYTVNMKSEKKSWSAVILS